MLLRSKMILNHFSFLYILPYIFLFLEDQNLRYFCISLTSIQLFSLKQSGQQLSRDWFYSENESLIEVASQNHKTLIV